jgi:hypothetical protein
MAAERGDPMHQELTCIAAVDDLRGVSAAGAFEFGVRGYLSANA